MTEEEFWTFLENALARGRIEQVSASSLESDDPEIQQAGQYMGGHSLLPEEYDKIPKDVIVEMGELLLKREVRRQTKEAIMMILAHHGSDEALSALEQYAEDPDKGLEIYCEFALDECRLWNED